MQFALDPCQPDTIQWHLARQLIPNIQCHRTLWRELNYREGQRERESKVYLTCFSLTDMNMLISFVDCGDSSLHMESLTSVGMCSDSSSIKEWYGEFFLICMDFMFVFWVLSVVLLWYWICCKNMNYYIKSQNRTLIWFLKIITGWGHFMLLV